MVCDFKLKCTYEIESHLSYLHVSSPLRNVKIEGPWNLRSDGDCIAAFSSLLQVREPAPDVVPPVGGDGWVARARGAMPGLL